MRCGLQLFGLRPDEYAPFVVRAEAVGFDTVWLGDHLITPVDYSSPYPYSDSKRPGYDESTPITDVFVLMGHLAALTSTVRLGTGVLILPLRNPFATARAAAAVQDLSAGRLRLGVGTGWLREEYDAVGEPFERRGQRLEEIVSILAALWSGEQVAHEGEAYRFDPVRFSPRPYAPIELTFGGTAERALERAARLGHGWFAPFWPLERVLPPRDRLTTLRRDTGREEPLACWIRMFDRAEQATVERYREAEVDHLVVGPKWCADKTAPLPDRLDGLERAAELLGLEPPPPSPARRATTDQETT